MYSVLVLLMKSPSDRAYCLTVARRIGVLYSEQGDVNCKVKIRKVKYWTSSLDGKTDVFSHIFDNISHDVVYYNHEEVWSYCRLVVCLR